VLFLADGRIVDEMERPTAEAVLERMKRFDVIRSQFETDEQFETDGQFERDKRFETDGQFETDEQE
jgi:putative ABC transport system ATP-binding protein